MPSIHALRSWTARTARRLLKLDRIAARSAIALFVVALWAGTGAAQEVYTVTSTSDTGNVTASGTLSWAIAQANANAIAHPSDTNTINFNLPSGQSTISLGGPLTPIDANVTINGAGTSGLTINGQNANAAFFVDSGTVKIENLAITNANAVGGAGGLGAGGGGGGLGAGGALFVGAAANVTINNVTFDDNKATGGTGGQGSSGNTAGGGGGGGFHGNGGVGNPAGGGGGGFAGNGGSAGSVFNGSSYGGGGGGGGLFGSGATPTNARGGGGGGGTTGNGQGNNGNSGGAGGSANGGTGASFESTGATSGGTGGGGGGGARNTGAGNGGYYGGGGGAGYEGTNAGAGGAFGGGGGAGSNENQPPGASGGTGGNGGFGGGGGGASTADAAGSGGFGAGNGGASGNGGNAGDAYGGAVFVQTGGTLTIVDSGISGSSVTAGVGGTGSAAGANGSTDGAGIYAMTGTTANLQVTTGSQTVSDAISGAGGINKTGSGALVLSGTNNYTGTTEVSAGTLSVNGSIASATTVDSGGTLGGSGAITGDVINNGNVAPGDPTTMTINGSYTQNAGGNMQIQINNAGTTPGVNSSLLVVNGTANIAGTVEVQPAAGSYAPGNRYIFLEATTVSGTFSGITLDTLSTMHATLGYGTITVLGTQYADAYFTLLANQSNFAADAQTPNQLAVANYIDANSTNPNSGMQSLVTTLNTLSPAGVQNALDQMSGALYGSVAQTDFQSTTLELSFITRRLANGLSGVNGASGGLAVNSYGDRISPAAGLASSDLGSGLTVRGQNSLNTFWPASRPAQSNWNSWGFGYGLGGNASGTSNAAGLNYSLGGTVVGLESLSENQAIGVYTGYVGSHLGSYLSGQSVGVNGGQTGVYLRRDDGRNYFILLGGMGADGYNSRRLMQFGGIDTTATANYGGWQSQAYLERGITLQGSKASIQPYAALQYLYVRQNSFTESGAGVMDLKVAGIDANSLRSLIGVRLAGNSWALGGGGPITPVARALWLHEFLSTTTGLNAQFAPIGGTNFAVTGTSLGRDWAILGAGLNWNLGHGWQTYANYDAQVNIQQTFHVGSGGFQYSW